MSPLSLSVEWLSKLTLKRFTNSEGCRHHCSCAQLYHKLCTMSTLTMIVAICSTGIIHLQKFAEITTKRTRRPWVNDSSYCFQSFLDCVFLFSSVSLLVFACVCSSFSVLVLCPLLCSLLSLLCLFFLLSMSQQLGIKANRRVLTHISLYWFLFVCISTHNSLYWSWLFLCESAVCHNGKRADHKARLTSTPYLKMFR